jgi:hypothetical protein
MTLGTTRVANRVESESPPDALRGFRFGADRSGNSMRLVACLTLWLMSILASGAQTYAQAPSDPQAYCVNRSADFYPYTGEPCKSGYQLGSGNCRKTDGHMVAVPREQCVAMACERS